MLKEGLNRRAELGLGPEGPVLNALRDSTHSSAAPLVGSATFVATIDSSGVVVDLRLVNPRPSGKDAEGGWDDALGRARDALAHKKLALRGAGGAELRIDVTSDYLLPSGNRPKGFPIQPTLRLNGRDPFRPKSLKSDDTLPLTIATFDLTDIAAKPQRVVHASLESLREVDVAPSLSAPAVIAKPDAGAF